VAPRATQFRLDAAAPKAAATPIAALFPFAPYFAAAAAAAPQPTPLFNGDRAADMAVAEVHLAPI